MRLLKIGFAALSLVVPPFTGCGQGSQTSASASDEGGQAGAGGESSSAVAVPDPVRCGLVTCQAIALPGATLAPCCADALGGICGAELPMALGGASLAATCQPLTQAGRLDPACPASSGGIVGGVPLPALPGCCRASGQCGYLVTDLGGLLPFAPGCIDSAAFSNGEAPVSCGLGASGEGGAGGVASTPAAGSNAGGGGGSDAGGAPGAAGASETSPAAGAAGTPGRGEGGAGGDATGP